MKNPTAFTSYSWDDDAHRVWVAQLATRLRSDGIDVKLDQWHAVPGDQLPAFMEREIRANDYVLIVCTPKYKLKSDGRLGGVGYEGDIMTAEVFTNPNHRKFIPILARGVWIDAAPNWLAGKYYVDLSSPSRFEAQYQDLLATVLGRRPAAPPLAPLLNPHVSHRDVPDNQQAVADPDIQILGVIVDQVSEPKGDGTPGSALYLVPFRLSRRPSSLWAQLFLAEWEFPPQFTTMHRPEIAHISGDTIILDGTTIEEVKRYHRDTLILCVREASKKERDHLQKLKLQKEAEQRAAEAHRKNVRDTAGDIAF